MADYARSHQDDTVCGLILAIHIWEFQFVAAVLQSGKGMSAGGITAFRLDVEYAATPVRMVGCIRQPAAISSDYASIQRYGAGNLRSCGRGSRG